LPPGLKLNSARKTKRKKDDIRLGTTTKNGAGNEFKCNNAAYAQGRIHVNVCPAVHKSRANK